MTSKKIRQTVNSLLEDNGITHPPVNIIEIARMLGADVRFVPFDDDVSGVLYREEDQVIIGVNESHHPFRKRFTIAHEIGHLQLHSEQLYVDRKYTIQMRDGKSALAVDPHEIEANSFAAELLMPYQMILKSIRGITIDYEADDSIAELAKEYGVSKQAMTLRLINLGVVDS
jgi:Zn-dependent peptidase ImmA (M78 family)